LSYECLQGLGPCRPAAKTRKSTKLTARDKGIEDIRPMVSGGLRFGKFPVRSR